MEIVKAKPIHFPQIILLEETAFGESLGMDLLNDAYSNPYIEMYAAVNGAHVLGYISASVSDELIDIYNFVVEEASRSKGIGTKLIDELFNNHQDITKATLEVRKSNVRAINFYQKRGFKEVSIRKNYYKNGEDAILMLWERI